MYSNLLSITREKEIHLEKGKRKKKGRRKQELNKN